MSSKTQHISTIKHSNSNTSLTQQAEPPELNAINSRLQHISDNIIQPSPYILTVPTDSPYKLDPRLANEWRRGVPLQDHEEQLQYVSFLPDWAPGLITAVGGWDDGKGEIMDTAQQQRSARSTTNTPGTGARVVKISLKDYKKKAAGQPRATSPETNGDRNVSRQPNGTGPTKHDKAPPKPASSPPRKRLRDEADAAKDRDESPPSKRQRTPPVAARPTDTRVTKPGSSLKLPPPISPTLPPAIEKELAKLSELSKLDNRDSSDKCADTGGLREEKLPKSGKHPSPSGVSRKSRPEDRAGTPPKANGASKHPPSSVRTGQKGQNQKEELRSAVASLDLFGDGQSKSHRIPEKRAVASGSSQRPSKVVKLKISKSIRKNLDWLLRFPPGQKSVESSKAVKEINPDKAMKTIERSPTRPAQMSNREKRPRQEDDSEGLGSQKKRRRQPSDLDMSSKPSTPIPPPFRSPVLSHHGSAQKAKASPNPDGRGRALQDYGNVSTPQAAIRNGTPSAPDSADRHGKDSRPPTSAASRPSKSVLSELHRTQYELFMLGRSLKHKSDHELKESQAKESAQLKKKSLSLGVESILCFMLSYAAKDELYILTRPATRDATWTTIFPLLTRAQQLAEGHTHLHGLCLQLEAVCRMAVWTSECERAALSKEHNSKEHAAMMKSYNAARNLFTDGAYELSVDDLQHSFPQTWRMKARAPLARAKFDPRVDGDFYLPITNITTGVEAVRAGRSLLVEWCRMEGVDWQPSIGTKAKQEGAGKADDKRRDK